MRRPLPLLLVLTACPTEPADLVVDLPTGPVEGEVIDYLFGMDAWYRTATATVTLDVQVGGDCIDLDYRAPAPDACRFDGQEGTCSVVGEVLTVCGPLGVADDSTLVVEVDLTVPKETEGSTDLGFSTARSGSDTDHYLLSWVGGCSRFGPCDADPATFATYTFEVAHEAGETLLCPGALSPGDTLSSCRFDLDGGPTYSTFGFALSSTFERVELGTAGDVALVWYDHDGGSQSRGVDPDDIADFVDFMEELAGPYPYGDELRFFSWDSYWSGFEHPGNVAMNQDLRPNPTSFRDNPLLHTTLHEVTHMWAGNQTTLASVGDFAWKEACAEYLAYVWEDDNGMGEPSVRYWKFVSSLATTFPVPDEELPILDFYGNAYGPGPMILFRQLEAMYGRDKVLDAFPLFLGNGEATASIDDVQAALEQAVGDDLDGYVDTWLRGTGEPSWPEIRATIEGDALRVEQLTTTGDAWPCAFHVRVTDDAGSVDIPVRYDLAGESTIVTASLPRTPGPEATIEVDPFNEALVYGLQTDLVEPTAAELASIRPH